MQRTPETLAAEWLAAKQEETAAAKRRAEIEAELLQCLECPEDGSKTHKIDGFKVTTTGRVTYRADMPHLLNLVEQLPENMRPVKTETVLDTTGAKWLRNNDPALWAIIAPAIEAKPGKTGFKIEPITE